MCWQRETMWHQGSILSKTDLKLLMANTSQYDLQ